MAKLITGQNPVSTAPIAEVILSVDGIRKVTEDGTTTRRTEPLP